MTDAQELAIDYGFTNAELDELDEVYLDISTIPPLESLGTFCAKLEQACANSEQGNPE